MTDIRANTAEPIEHLAVDFTGAVLTSASGLRASVRRSDGLFYDWNDATFKSPASATTLYGALAAVNATYAPGSFSVSWPGAAAGVYVAEVTQSPAGSVARLPARVEIRVGQAAAAVELAAVQTDVDDLQARTPATLVGGRTPVVVQAMDTDVVSAASVSASAVTKIQSGLAVPGSAMTLTSGERTTVQALVISDATPFPGARIDATISSRSTLTAAQVDTQLSGSHGGTAWTTATGFSTHSATDVWAVSTRDLTRIGSSGIASQVSVDALPDAFWATAEGTPTVGTYGYAAVLGRKSITNRREVDTTGGGRSRLFDDDATTAIVTQTVRDGAGNSITTPAGSPARVGAAA